MTEPIRKSENGGSDLMVGRVVQLFQQGGYGFIETADGCQICFHGHSVLHDRYADLEIGDCVQFACQNCPQGREACMISILNRRSQSTTP